MRKIFFVFFTLIIALPSLAQTSTQDLKEEHKERENALAKEDEEGVITYKKHFAGGIKLISDGYGLFLESGRAKSIKKSWLFQLEIAERKSPKEVKQDLSDGQDPSFIFGKENFFYPIKLGVQEQILLGNKSNKNGVNITANYGGGVTLGILRPYLINVIEKDTFNNQLQVIETFNDLFTSPDTPLFLSGPTLAQGWSNLSVVPGLYAKAALRFDYAHDNEVMSALEVGVSAEYYTQKIPLIIFTDPKQFFMSAYVTIIFGGRW